MNYYTPDGDFVEITLDGSGMYLVQCNGEYAGRIWHWEETGLWEYRHGTTYISGPSSSAVLPDHLHHAPHLRAH